MDYGQLNSDFRLVCYAKEDLVIRKHLTVYDFGKGIYDLPGKVDTPTHPGPANQQLSKIWSLQTYKLAQISSSSTLWSVHNPYHQKKNYQQLKNIVNLSLSLLFFFIQNRNCK